MRSPSSNLSDQQRAQLLRRDDQRLAGLQGTRIDQRRPTVSWASSPVNCPGPWIAIGFVIRQFVVPANLDLSCQNDREPVGNLTGPRQNLAGANERNLPKRRIRLDFSGSRTGNI